MIEPCKYRWSYRCRKSVQVGIALPIPFEVAGLNSADMIFLNSNFKNLIFNNKVSKRADPATLSTFDMRTPSVTSAWTRCFFHSIVQQSYIAD